MTLQARDTTLTVLASHYAQRAPAPRFSRRGRTARRFAVAADHEVWLMAWLPGQGTPLHDHGGVRRPAEAAFAVVEGVLREYAVRPGAFPALEHHDVAAGDRSAVTPRTVHAVRNDRTAPAVSVHVYAPRLELMRAYRLDESGMSLGAIHRAGTDW